jgi:ferrochelatase
VNLIIVPFRAPKSAKIYKELWTKDGSPLLIHGKIVTQKLQERIASKADVFFAMRYQNPSIDSVLEEIRKKESEIEI